MDTEERKDDELFTLGCITGLCNQVPRDNLALEGILLLLVKAQEARDEIGLTY